MQERSYLDKSAQISVGFRRLLTLIITWVYKDSLTLTYPPNINILIDITIQIPTSKFFDTIIDDDYI